MQRVMEGSGTIRLTEGKSDGDVMKLALCSAGLGLRGHHQVHKSGPIASKTVGELGDGGQGAAVITGLIAVGHAGAVSALVFHAWWLALQATFEETIAKLLGELFIALLLLSMHRQCRRCEQQGGSYEQRVGVTKQHPNRRGLRSLKQVKMTLISGMGSGAISAGCSSSPGWCCRGRRRLGQASMIRAGSSPA